MRTESGTGACRIHHQRVSRGPWFKSKLLLDSRTSHFSTGRLATRGEIGGKDKPAQSPENDGSGNHDDQRSIVFGIEMALHDKTDSAKRILRACPRGPCRSR